MCLSIRNKQANGHLASLQFGAIMNDAVMNITVHILRGHMNVSFRYVPKNAVIGSKGMHVLNFRNRVPISQNGHVIDYKNVHNFHSFLYPHPFMI